MKTTRLKKQQEATHDWYVVNVNDKVLGRAASEIASLLKGKNRVDYTPHVDGGSGVIVLNCDKLRVTGRKGLQKVYKRYSGYPSGQKITTHEKMMEKDPKYAIRHAVKGMLPKNKLGARMLKRLKLYKGDTHPHAAQSPKEKKI